MLSLRVVVLAACLALASCGGGGGLDDQLGIRLIYASPDSPPANLLIDGVPVRSGLDYKAGTEFFLVSPGSYDLAFEAILPGGNTALVIDQPDMALRSGMEYTLIAVGKDETDTVRPLLIENTVEGISSGSARVQIAHAAPDTGAIDVYLTPATAGFPGDVAVAQLSFEGVSPRVPVATGIYVIRITPANDPGVLLYQSGSITLTSQDDLLLVPITNTATGPAAISILVNDGFSSREVLDSATTSDVRVINTSPDSTPLDVTGDPATDGRPTVSFADALAFPNNTGYLSILPDVYFVNGVLDADPNPTTPPFSLTRTFGAGERATLVATGLLASLSQIVLADEIRPVWAEGRIRVIDASPASGTVDVYVVPTGTDITGTEATLQNFVLQTATAHLAFVPGDYTVTVTRADTKEILATAAVPATAGRVFTVVLVDEVRVDASSDGQPPELLVIEDLS